MKKIPFIDRVDDGDTMKIRLETVEGFSQTVTVESAHLFRLGGHGRLCVYLPRLTPDIFMLALGGKNLNFASLFVKTKRKWRGLPVFAEDQKPYSLELEST